MYHPIITVIRNDLKEKKISRSVFAEMCGYSVSNVHNWLTGVCTPKLTVAEDMLNALGYDLIVRKKVQKLAHWIIMGDRYIKCSECGHITKTESPDIYNFCMVCGAKMEDENV